MSIDINNIFSSTIRLFKLQWIRIWFKFHPLGPMGKLSSLMTSIFAPAYKNRVCLTAHSRQGFITYNATIAHPNVSLGKRAYIGDRVTIYQAKDGGPVVLGEGVHLYSDINIETGDHGQIHIGDETHIQPRCSLSAYKGSIHIGRRVEIAPNCGFYPYNHQFAIDKPVREQGLTSKGNIIIGDEAWLGFGVIVLDGVRIGEGAVIGAGSVVTKDIPANAVVAGNPARVLKMRT